MKNSLKLQAKFLEQSGLNIDMFYNATVTRHEISFQGHVNKDNITALTGKGYKVEGDISGKLVFYTEIEGLKVRLILY